MLSQLQRESRMPLRQLGLRAQVSPSYLSRVFSGEKFPTWDLTEKLALALGADSQSLYKVWQDERARTTVASTTRDQPPEDLSPLHSALRTLSRRASSPSPRLLAAATGGDLTEQQIREVFRGSHVPDWPQTQNLVLALDVLTREVGDAAGGWLALECGVSAVVIVGVEPGGVCLAPLGLAPVCLRVGPFVQQRPVEPFHLAVCLGSVRPGALV